MISGRKSALLPAHRCGKEGNATPTQLICVSHAVYAEFADFTRKFGGICRAGTRKFAEILRKFLKFLREISQWRRRIPPCHGSRVEIVFAHIVVVLSIAEIRRERAPVRRAAPKLA